MLGATMTDEPIIGPVTGRVLTKPKSEKPWEDVVVPIAPERSWYAIMTEARSEALADLHLRRQGIMTWYPFNRIKRRRKLATGQHRIEVIEVAVLPRYLFVLVGDGQISAVNDTVGVATVVKAPFSRKALAIPGRVMDRLMASLERDKFEDKTRVEFAGRVGQYFVFSEDSPFSGLLGTILSLEGLDERNQIVAELQLLGSERPITVPLSAVGKLV